MERHLLAVCVCFYLVTTLGCATCVSPHDCKYAAFGGIRERTDMARGRVGSAFDPAPEISHVVRTQQSPTFESIPSEPADGTSGTGSSASDSGDSGEPDNGRGEDDTDAGKIDLPELPNEGRLELPDLPETRSDSDLPLLETRVSPSTTPAGETPETKLVRRNPLVDLFETQFR